MAEPGEPQHRDQEPVQESMPEQPATDLSVVLGLIKFIKEPAADKDGNTLRADWLRTARDVLEAGTLKSPSAIKMLEAAIKTYSEK